MPTTTYNVKMTPEEFEQLVDEGIAAIPERFLKKLSNVAIVVEEAPSREQVRQLAEKMRLHHGHTLLGLYEGIPQTRRQHYGVGGAVPDRITIFRRPIEWASGGDPGRVRDIVRDTVWHEIAHHFGMGEAQVRRHEAQRRRQTAST